MIVFDLDDTLYLEREFAFSGYRFLDGWVKERESLEGFGNACRVLFEEGERRLWNAHLRGHRWARVPTGTWEPRSGTWWSKYES